MTTNAAPAADLPELEIRIRRQPNARYGIELIHEGDQVLSVDDLAWAPETLAALGATATEPAARRFTAWFFADPAVREAWATVGASSPQLRIRLHLDVDAPELHRLPWELLSGPGAAAPLLAADGATPFSRYLPAGAPLPGPVARLPLRLLVAIAAPVDLRARGLSPIDAQAERRALEAALSSVPAARLQLSFLEPPITPAALQAALNRDVHFLHIVAHGHFAAADQTTTLYLADEANRTLPVSEATLGRIVTDASASLRLVYLSSCETAARSADDAWRGLAPQLLAAGIPAVLAMRQRIGMTSARTFAATFYRELLAQGYADWAANRARATLLDADLPGAAIPALFSRLEDNRLVRPPRAAVRQSAPRARLIEQVDARWVTGILHVAPATTASEARVLHERPTAVAPLGDVGVPQQQGRTFTAATPLVDLFTDTAGSALLLLGEAGAGKTTLLLELADALLTRARQDAAAPVPAVFELRNWSADGGSLDAWLTSELTRTYGLAPALARDLLARHDVALLLDGLDELPAQQRAACVAQINRYRTGAGGLTAIAVTCDEAAYVALPARLNLRNALFVEPQPSTQQPAVDLELRIDETADDDVAVTLVIDRHRRYGGERRDPAALIARQRPPDGVDGAQLFEWLFATGPMRTEWLRAYRQSSERSVRLRIAPSLGSLIELPWERLRNPPGESAYATPLVNAETVFYRYLPNQHARPTPVYRRPLRVLVALLNPPGLTDADHSEIDAAAEEALQQAVFFGLEENFDVEYVGFDQPLSLALLSGALWGKSFDILHLVGCAVYSAARDEAALLMARPEGDRVAPVGERDLVDALARLSSDMPDWIVFSHPHDTTQTSSPGWKRLAPALLQGGVYGLCAEQSPLEPSRHPSRAVDEESSQSYRFYRAFYTEIAASGRFDLAHSAANGALPAEDGHAGAAPAALFSRTADLRVALTQQPETAAPSPERRHQLILLSRVRSSWIDSILRPSLSGLALIEIPKKAIPEAVDAPITYEIDAGRPRIVDIFDQADGALLILGAPGSGKTFILLELARDLVVAAQQDAAAPIPVVFNLSSWRNTERNLTDWMVRELQAMYYIPERYSRNWIEEDRILPLLDSFDEVQSASRPLCAQAINAFRRQHPQGQIVVCSRTDEYEELFAQAEDARLQLNAAVGLLALTGEQVDDYLRTAGPALAALRAVMREDPILFELAQAPLMLNVMIVAYADLPQDALRGYDTVDARRRHLFGQYVERAFHPIAARPRNRYPVDQTKRWLGWLARELNWHGQSIFLLENLQPSWLTKSRSLWAYVLGSRLAVGLIGGLIGGLVISLGLIVVDLQWLNEHPMSSLTRTEIVRSNLWRGILEGGFGGLMGGLVIGLIDVAGLARRQEERAYLPLPTTRESALRALWVGLTIWGAVTLTFAALFGTLEWRGWIDWFWCYGEQNNPTFQYSWWRCSVGHAGEGVQVALVVALSFITIFRTTENRQDPKDDIRTTEYLHWARDRAWQGGAFGLVRGLVVGAVVAGIGLLGVMDGNPLKEQMPDNLFIPFIVLLTVVFSIAFGVLRNGLRGTIIEGATSYPNQGIQLSFKNAGYIGVSYGLSFALLGAAAGAVVGFFSGEIAMTTLVFGAYGIFFGLLAAIWYGGLDIIKHYWLRSMLWGLEEAPPVHHYVPFFRNAAELVLLRETGGSYLFYHRLLQDYFADLSPDEMGMSNPLDAPRVTAARPTSPKEASMTDELFYFNGVNGDTGDYDLTPMTAERLFDVLRGTAEPENIKELEYRVQWETEEHLGVVEGVDPTKIEEAGWGVIFPADPEGTFVPAIKDALQPLLALRQSQAGDLFRIYEGVDALRPGESKVDFLVRHGVPPADPANPEKMPFYLLLVGSPEQIPYRFQSQLDVQYAVGRIHFETLQEYANYAASVTAAETGQVALPREAAFFGVMNQDDRATELSTTRLMEPLLTQMTPAQHEWTITGYLREQATKAQLRDLLGGASTPALLFSASHGVPFSLGSSRQIPHQGALLCADWPGPKLWGRRGAIPQDFYLAGDDLTDDANLLGMMAFFFACYGGGTPLRDDFPKPGTTTLQQIAERPFLARLPMHMLGREKGGALAVIAHVERAWGASFTWTRNIEQTDVFKSTLMHLMNGNPIGSALEYFNSRYATWAAELSTTLRDVQFGLQVEPTNISSMWTAHNDARGYAIIGDPAARLPLASHDGDVRERPSIVVQPADGQPAPPLPRRTGSETPATDPAIPAPDPESMRNFGIDSEQEFGTKDNGPLAISTYTAEEPASAERALFAQTRVTPGGAVETTVYGSDAQRNEAMLNLHSSLVGHALGRTGRRRRGVAARQGALGEDGGDVAFGIETPQEDETSIPIAPVEPPTPVDETELPFLPEVTDFLWVDQARAAFQVDGSGLTVAVLDTGLNASHIDFAGRVPAQVNFTSDNGGDQANADDGNGHGTNVGGIIVASGNHIGIAPGANIVPIKVLPNHTGGDFAWIDSALQWVIDHRAEHNITAVCMSLGDSGNYTDDTFAVWQALRNSIRRKIQQLRDARVAVVIAAGNDYYAHESRQGMGFPAIVRECVSVGAVYDSDGGGFSYSSGARATSTQRGQITPFSQRLHSSVNAATQTDIFGPGAPVTASGIGGPEASSTQHGTSQATPVVAGLILLLQEFYRRWRDELPTVDQLTGWLRQGGVAIFDGDDENDNVRHTNLAFVRADALSALDAARREIQALELKEKMTGM